MGAILSLFRFLLTASAGWTVSDIYNTYQSSKQSGVNLTLAESVKQSSSQNWLKWVIILAVTTVIYLIISPFINKKQTR